VIALLTTYPAGDLAAADAVVADLHAIRVAADGSGQLAIGVDQ
jgi:hypothetical protein